MLWAKKLRYRLLAGAALVTTAFTAWGDDAPSSEPRLLPKLRAGVKEAKFAQAEPNSEQVPVVKPEPVPPTPVEVLPKSEICPPVEPEKGGKPVPPTEPFQDPPIKPTLLDFLKAKPVAKEIEVRKTDPLLRPPFAGQPVENIKGLAAGIRAVELDAKNRMLAAQYLGTVDCVLYPQAKEMLIQAMLEDPQEEVRYEAVMALRLMLTHGYHAEMDHCACDGCCNRRDVVEETQEHAAAAKKAAPKVKLPLCAAIAKAVKAPKVALKHQKDVNQNGPLECRRYDWCRGCCGARALQALSKVAYDKDEFGCPVEPSARVRQAAVDGLCLCPCEPAPQYYVPVQQQQQQNMDGTGGEQVPPGVPPAVDETKATTAPNLIGVKATGNSAPSLKALNGYCVVNLQMKKFVAGKQEFSTVFEGHTYQFASAEARDEFERFPEAYAPVYAGADPIEKVDNKRIVEGRFVRMYEGKVYLFATKEGWEIFKKNPQRYLPSEIETTSAVQ